MLKFVFLLEAGSVNIKGNSFSFQAANTSIIGGSGDNSYVLISPLASTNLAFTTTGALTIQGGTGVNSVSDISSNVGNIAVQAPTSAPISVLGGSGTNAIASISIGKKQSNKTLMLTASTVTLQGGSGVNAAALILNDSTNGNICITGVPSLTHGMGTGATAEIRANGLLMYPNGCNP